MAAMEQMVDMPVAAVAVPDKMAAVTQVTGLAVKEVLV
jgi:hypothetical protein